MLFDPTGALRSYCRQSGSSCDLDHGYARIRSHSRTNQAKGATLAPSCEVRQDDLLQGPVNRIWRRAVGMSGYADCIDDLGEPEIAGRRGDGFFQPAGSGAFAGLLGFPHCAVHRGLRTVGMFPEEMNPAASATLINSFVRDHFPTPSASTPSPL